MQTAPSCREKSQPLPGVLPAPSPRLNGPLYRMWWCRLDLTFLKRRKRRPAVCLSEHDCRPFLREPPLSFCHAAHESAARWNGRQHNRGNRSNGSRYQHLYWMWCRQQKLASLRSLQKCTLLQQRMPTRALVNSPVPMLTNLGEDGMQCCTLCHWYVVGHAQAVLITVHFV